MTDIEIEALIGPVKHLLPQRIVGLYNGRWFDDEGYSDPSAVVIRYPRLKLERGEERHLVNNGLRVYRSEFFETTISGIMDYDVSPELQATLELLPVGLFVMYDPTIPDDGVAQGIMAMIEDFNSQYFDCY